MSTTILEEESVGSVGLKNGSFGLLDARREGELDLAVVHLLDKRSPGLAGVNLLNPEDLQNERKIEIQGLTKGLLCYNFPEKS